MSLHNIAQHMQSAGRGDDKMLVHMTPGEVQGLQKIAMAHGGSLTINPKTGLPEAGFLSSLLPMIAGFALGPGGFALMSAPAAGLAVGAASTLATGSLSKGIMAGLGAYGGAGLGAGAEALGAAAGAAGPTASTLGSMAQNAAPSAFPSMIPANLATPITGGANLSGLTQAGGFTGLPVSSLASAPVTTPAFASALPEAALPKAPPLTTVAQPQVRMMPEMPPPPPPARSVMFGGGAAPVSGQPVYTPSSQLYAQQHPVLAGLKAATSDGIGGLKSLYGSMEEKAPYSGMAAGYSLMGALNQPNTVSAKKSKSLIRPYTLERKRVIDKDVGPSSSAEQRYFNDVYTAQTPYEAPGPEYAANGGVMRMADGGYVNETLNQNAVNFDGGRPLPQQQPLYMGMQPQQPQQPQQNIISQPGNTMSTPGFANGGIASFSDGGELPEYEYLGGNKYRLKNPPATTTAGKVSSTGQPLDALGGYYGPYGQYINAAGQPQMWYMDPANYGPDAILSAKTAGVNLKAPKTAASAASAPIDTLEGLEALYQKNLGRAADTSGIESYVGKGYTPEQITGFMQASEEYKPAQEKLAAEAKAAAAATPTQIANMYSDIFGRSPDVAGLDYYANQQLAPEDIKKSLMASEEYKKKLTTPFVAPISYAGSTLPYSDIEKQLGHAPTLQEIETANKAFVPYQATIEGAPQYRSPEQQLGLGDFYTKMNAGLDEQNYAAGGDINAYSLGGYSDGGRLLRGPGDGVSDDIPASIGDRQPARLADGEFVVPARIVSELGNGSTEAGAKRLYAMMDRVQRARTKTMGKGKVAVNSKADKYLPA